MSNKRNEVSYYPEIQNYIEIQLKSNFLAKNRRELYVYWGIGELKTNLQRIISEHPIECACVSTFAKLVQPLSLDIFALITDSKKFEILILEIKLVPSAGLSEWSQLIGYCLVSSAKYGLLVNIDSGGSPRLVQMLSTELHISHIKTVIKDELKEHYLGFMQWDSLTKDFKYSNLGAVKSLSELSECIAREFG